MVLFRCKFRSCLNGKDSQIETRNLVNCHIYINKPTPPLTTFYFSRLYSGFSNSAYLNWFFKNNHITKFVAKRDCFGKYDFFEFYAVIDKYVQMVIDPQYECATRPDNNNSVCIITNSKQTTPLSPSSSSQQSSIRRPPPPLLPRYHPYAMQKNRLMSPQEPSTSGTSTQESSSSIDAADVTTTTTTPTTMPNELLMFNAKLGKFEKNQEVIISMLNKMIK